MGHEEDSEPMSPSLLLNPGWMSQSILDSEPVSPSSLHPGWMSPNLLDSEPVSPSSLHPGWMSPKLLDSEPVSPSRLDSEPMSRSLLDPEPVSPNLLDSEPMSPSLLDPRFFKQSFCDVTTFANDVTGLDYDVIDLSPSPIRRRLARLTFSSTQNSTENSFEFWNSQPTQTLGDSIFKTEISTFKPEMSIFEPEIAIVKPEIAIVKPEISVKKDFKTTGSRNIVRRKLIDLSQSPDNDFFSFYD